MKRIVAWALVLIMCATMVACTQNPTNDTPHFETEYKLHDGAKAIIVLPGILASGLWDTDTQECLWDPLVTDEVDVLEFVGAYDSTHVDISLKNIAKEMLPLLEKVAQTLASEEDENGNPLGILQRIMCDQDGQPRYAVDGVPFSYQGHQRYGAVNSYKWLAQGLQELVGEEYQVEVFNYNWVTDTRAAANKLSLYLREKNYTDVILVGHSMGGVVGSLYLAGSAENRARVDKFIALGTPFYGSYSVNEMFDNCTVLQDMMRNGFDGLKATYGLDLSEMKDYVDGFFQDVVVPFLYNMKSMYQLLPSPKLIALQQPDSGAGVCENGNKVAAADLYQWYCGRPWATDNPLEQQDLPPRAICSDLEAFWASFMVDTAQGKVFAADLVDTYYVAGDGVRTTVGYDLVDGKMIVKSSTRGDGTVPFLSATRGQEVDNQHVFCIEGMSHIPLGCLWDSAMGPLVSQIILGTTQQEAAQSAE